MAHRDTTTSLRANNHRKLTKYDVYCIELAFGQMYRSAFRFVIFQNVKLSKNPNLAYITKIIYRFRCRLFSYSSPPHSPQFEFFMIILLWSYKSLIPAYNVFPFPTKGWIKKVCKKFGREIIIRLDLKTCLHDCVSIYEILVWSFVLAVSAFPESQGLHWKRHEAWRIPSYQSYPATSAHLTIIRAGAAQRLCSAW